MVVEAASFTWIDPSEKVELFAEIPVAEKVSSMKNSIAVTLIIMGTLLVMTPVLADVMYQRNVVDLMASSGVTSVTLSGQMGDRYRFGCWLTGSGMVGVVVLSTMFGNKPTSQPDGTRQQV